MKVSHEGYSFESVSCSRGDFGFFSLSKLFLLRPGLISRPFRGCCRKTVAVCVLLGVRE